MERQGQRRPRNRTKIVLAGASMMALLAAPLAGSAALDGGRFFVHAWNVDEPTIEARAGMGGLSADAGGNPGGGQTGGGTGPETEQPTFLDERATESLTCGAETVSITDQMLKFSDENKELVANGGEAKTWPGGDWKFIKIGPGWEVISGTPAPVAFDFDRTYILSNEITPGMEGAHTMLADYQPAFFIGGKYTSVGNMHMKQFEGAKGIKPSMISAYSVNLNGNQISTCTYSKFQDGKLGSANDSPANYREDKNGAVSAQASVWAKNGLPAFGPERISTEIVYDWVSDKTRRAAYYLPSNGDLWDYEPFELPGGSLWHATKQDVTGTVNGKASGFTTVWQDCWDDNCSSKIDIPLISKRTDKTINDRYFGPGYSVSYDTPTIEGTRVKIQGATNIAIEMNADTGLPVSKYYQDYTLGSNTKYSRTDGPAVISYNPDGSISYKQYYIEGEYMSDRAAYEAKGGRNWS